MNRIIGWFANNSVAANLLMLVILVGGVFTYPAINREFIPPRTSDTVEVSVPYRGAGPEEVEDRILIRIEEAVSDLDGIKKIRSIAREGSGTVTMEVQNGFDTRKLLNDVKARVDGINTFPTEAERPIVSERVRRVQVMQLTLNGDVDQKTLKRVAENIRDDLAALKEVDTANVQAVLPYEVAIEVEEVALRRYGLSFDDIVRAVRSNSLNLPAGSIRSEAGTVTLRTRGQAYTASDFEQIAVLRRDDGTIIRVVDVAKVIDGFQEADLISRFNGKPAALIEAFVTADPNVVETSTAIRAYLDELAPRLPDGMAVEVLDDRSETFSDRLRLLLENGIGGLVLVFVVLLLFLRPAVAFWVAAGIGIAFVGTIWVLPWFGVSLNMISLFAFLMVLGIVVDDAIIVGESIHSMNERGVRKIHGATLGTQAVSKPVFFAVTTTILAFMPMLFVPGNWRDVAQQIPYVVIAALVFSLIESMLILPSHLSSLKREKEVKSPRLARLQKAQQSLAQGMQRFAEKFYAPVLDKALQWRGLTLVSFIVIFGLTVAVVGGGWMRVSFFPNIQADFVFSTINMPEGAAFSKTEDTIVKLEAAANRASSMIEEETGEAPLKSLLTIASGNSLQGWAILEKTESEDASAQAFANRWRKELGALPEADEIKFSSSFGDFRKPIQFQLASADLDQLDEAVSALKEELSTYSGVYDIRDSLSSGRREIILDLDAQAQSLQLGLADLANQVRQGFFGAEAQRIPRGKDDVRVMVRYPKETRESVDSLQDLRVRIGEGTEVPFEAVADARYDQGHTQIERVDRQRVAVITAEMRRTGASPGEVMGNIIASRVPELRERFPQVDFALDGDSVDQQEFTGSLLRNMLIAIGAMYVLLAVAFRSYGQPLIILTAIPFGFTGAIIGHLVMGMDLAMFSFLGIVAAAGVVVNDNLVLIDRVNALRSDEGFSVMDALRTAARDRFRPIILTSITTFIGLVPIMSETSIQAQFLIPMVISLAFGVGFATTVTLILVPCVYSLGYGWKHRTLAFFRGEQYQSQLSAQEAAE